MVTAFLVQSSVALRDPTKINNYLLSELIAVERAVANGEPVDDVPSSRYSPGDHTGELTDFWSNALWIMSLTLSLSSALVAVLIKQWIRHYIAPVLGSPRDRAHVRQYRFNRLQHWRVPLIIDLLPAILHLALFTFLAGLGVYFIPLHVTLSRVVWGTTAVTFIVYFWSMILPIQYPGNCSYYTPISEILLMAYHRVSGYLGFDLGLVGSSKATPKYTQPCKAKTVTCQESLHREYESENVAQHRNLLSIDSLWWLSASSTNSSLPKILAAAKMSTPFGLMDPAGFSAEGGLAYRVAARGTSESSRERYEPGADAHDIHDIFDHSRGTSGGKLATAMGLLRTLTLIHEGLLDMKAETHHDTQKAVDIPRSFHSLACLVSDGDTRLPPSLWFGLSFAAKCAVLYRPRLTQGNYTLYWPLLCWSIQKMLIEAIGPCYHPEPAQHSWADSIRVSEERWNAIESVPFKDIADDVNPFLGAFLFENLRVNQKRANLRPEPLGSCHWPAVFRAFGHTYKPHRFQWKG